MRTLISVCLLFAAALTAGCFSSEARPVCTDCGRIESISPRSVDGEASPVAAIAGAIIGGALGHQFGDGSGQKAATAAGAIGGAMAGTEIQRRRKRTTVYDLVIVMDTGERLEMTHGKLGGIAVGDRVKVRGERLIPLASDATGASA